MVFLVYAGIAIFAALIVISLVWRFLSQRSTLPCPVWLSWLLELNNPFTTANRASVIVENLNLKPAMNVVDVGCGPGRITIPIAHSIGQHGMIVAMDIQSGMLDRVKVKAQNANLTNIHYLNAGIGEGKLSHNYFDRAVLVTVLGEIPDQKSAIKEIFDALKPGGLLSIAETIFDPHFQNQARVERLALEVGFKKKSSIGNRLAYTLLLQK